MSTINASEISRRKFLSGFIFTVGGVVAAGLGVPLIGYFLSPVLNKSKPLLSSVANISDLPVGIPTYVTYELRIREGWFITTMSQGAWILNRDGKEIIAYNPKCTHLNCPYYWDKEKKIFTCPCHDGKFDIDGKVIGGPPPRPLDRLATTIENGTIFISSTTGDG